MTTLCLRRHILYSAWRSPATIITYGSSGSNSIPFQSPSNVLFHNTRSSRLLHSSPVFLKDGRGKNSVKQARRKSLRIRRIKAIRKNAARDNTTLTYNPLVTGTTAPLRRKNASQTGSNDQLDTARTLDKTTANVESLVEHLTPQENERRDDHPHPDWHPFTAEGRDDLQAMVAALETLTQEASDQPRTLKTLAQEASTIGQNSINFPIRSFTSPIEDHILDGEAREIRKRQPAAEDMNVQLERNPWARMLSEPIRLDTGTRARMPRKLLTSWGIVRNPRTLQDFTVPIELSDLPALRAQLQYDEASVDTDAVVQDRARAAKHPEGERFYMQPSKRLIKTITNAVVKYPKGKDPAPRITSGILSSGLIPYRWREAVSKAQVFRRTQTVIDETTGEEISYQDWKQTLPNFDTLQWQPDIESRIDHILSERVMIALESLLTHNSSSKGIRAKRVYAMELPGNGSLVLDGTAVVSADCESSSSTPQSTSAADEVSSTVTWHAGSIFLHVGTAEEYIETIADWEDKYDDQNSQRSSDPDHISPMPKNTFAPPMITITALNDSTSPKLVRCPVFNLAALLGPTYTSRIEKIIRDHDILELQFWKDYDAEKQERLIRKHDTTQDQLEKSSFTSPNSQNQSSDDMKSSSLSSEIEQETQKDQYIVLIKNNAVKLQEFMDELWQLWRYIGGRDGLSVDHDNHDTNKIVDDIDTFQIDDTETNRKE